MRPDRRPGDSKGFEPVRGTRPRRLSTAVFVLPVILLLASVVQAAEPAPGATSNSDYVIRTWETADGLPDSSTTSIAQAPDGYLWIGTFGGLVRFNGVHFTVFNSANTPDLSSDGIVNLHIDGAGRLLVSTYGGLVMRDGTQWRHIRKSDGSAGDFVRSFTERSHGDLLITMFNGKIFEFSGDVLTQLPAPPGEPGQGFLGGVDEDGLWWIVQNKFVGRWESGKWVAMVSPPDLLGDAVGIAPARDGGMWLLLGAELRKLRHGLEVGRTTLPERLGGVWSISEDSRGNIWIASYNQGFFRFSPDGVMTNYDAADGWSDGGRCVFEDREQNLWLGTGGDGLFRLVPRRFQHYELAAGRRGVLAHSVTADPRGGVWVGTYGKGLAGLSNGVVIVPPLNDTPYLQSVLSDQSHRLWIGSLGKPLRLLNQDGTLAEAPAFDDNVIALFEDSRRQIWMGNGGRRVGRYNNENFQIYDSRDGLGEGVNCFGEDRAGSLWAASGTAVFRRIGESPFVEVLGENGKHIGGVKCLKGDEEGSMWMGTQDRGLLRWKDGALSRLDEQHALPFGSVQAIVDDQRGHLWIASGQKIVRASLTDLQVVADRRQSKLICQVFDEDDGLPRADFTSGRQPNSARDSKGRLWFATSKGVVAIDPAELRINAKVPPVHVEKVSFFGAASLRREKSPGRDPGESARTQIHGPFEKPVVLPAGSSSIEITFACLSLAAAGKAQYQVLLEGLDPDWREIASHGMAYFARLAPGDYVFRVRAANNDGVWNEAGTSLRLTVLPFYWQTAWFRVLLALVLAGLGAALAWRWSRMHTLRALELQRTAEQIRELAGRLINAQEQERTRLARELHDDITQRLARLAIDVGRCEQGTTDRSPEETAREVRAGLVQLSEDVHALSYRLHPSILEDLGLAEALKAEIDRFQRQNSIAVKVNLRELADSIPRESALCLFRVAQEALRNVARHSRASTVEVSLRPADEGLQLAVQDNGAGFDPAVERQRPSLGLSSMKERVLLLGGELEIESAPGQGAMVLAWVPLKSSKAES